MPKVSYHRLLDEHLHTLIAQGNHEALEKLEKRYHRHAVALCHDILAQYPRTGISIEELMAVCENSFVFIVSKFDPAISSFFTFWKEHALHRVMDYLINNSFNTDSSILKRNVSMDQEFGEEDNRNLSAFIYEKDDNREKKRKIFEVKNVIAKHDDVFTKQESALLFLVLDGYTIPELEHSGVMSRSGLYLTFNSAINKLRKLIKKIKPNKY